MKRTFRLALGLWLVVAIAACSLPSGLPALSPTETATPSLTPTSTPSPTPTITPTPAPLIRVTSGDRSLFNGDYDLALGLYQTAFRDSSDPAVRAAAKWGEARTLYTDERYADALAVLQIIQNEYTNSSVYPESYFLQGLIYHEMQRYLEAASAWQVYLTLRPGVLDAYTQELRGDALTAAGDYTAALAAYLAAIQAPRLDDGIYVDLKVAQTRANLGQYDEALALYDGIAARTSNDYLRAQAAYHAAQAYQALGQAENAQARFRLAVENYPLAYHSYLSLVELLNAGAEVSDLDRGLVDYFAGQYDVALQALDRYLAANPIHDGTARYYRALTLREMGKYEEAVAEFSLFIQEYSPHPQWTEAWAEKAYLQWAELGLNEQAAQTLSEYATIFPESESAPEYLMSAARILERDNRLDEAADIWARVANQYPGSELASQAFFMMGIARYRQGRFDVAQGAFTFSLDSAIWAEDRARAHLWIGKTQLQLGNQEAAQQAWQQAQSLDPGGYYSERARDLLSNPQPFAPPAASNLNIDLAAERTAADTWVKVTFNLPADTDLRGLGPLAYDERILRGSALWNLGLYEDARLEFESLRESLSGDAEGSYRLANYLLDLGLYRSSIFAARQVLTLAGLDDHSESMMAPPYFSHLRYGLYYSDLIVPAAQAEGFDPLFIFSVVRQESMFEGFVSSSAGAHGLMQVIPATGAQIANQLGWPIEYVQSDLYRPNVSVRFGTHYLASNRDFLDGNLYAALAAYNGGPGNASAWYSLSGGDPDLLLEIVRFEETRLYIRNIYEIYVIYRRLYGNSTIQ
ncbi:MAG: tetratricopeptide repeat protein [Chloroflexota bacterium]